MPGTIPIHPKIYHILHHDRLSSVVQAGGLYCDTESTRCQLPGTDIGLPNIKERRRRCPLRTKPSLHVGECVPFYFCPRSVMLYLYWRNNNTELTYRGGQEPIVHLVADMEKTIRWAQQQGVHWAFTDSNAGSSWFEDYDNPLKLVDLHWDIIESRQWDGWTDGQKTQAFKQAEFLVERFFPWDLVEQIGVIDERRAEEVRKALTGMVPSEIIKVHRDWYY